MAARLDALESKRSVSQKRLIRRLRRLTGQAVADFSMIEDGDRVMVCLSGGKDSYTLLDMLLGLQRVAPVRFAMTAVNLDQQQPGFPADVLPTYLADLGVDYEMLNQDTYSVVRRIVPDGKTQCGLCSRLRRGALYSHARTAGFTKIALGHHRDDLIETLFLNLFHGGRLAGMAPKLLSDDGACIVIRPLAYCRETDIEKYACLREFPIIPCRLCGSQQNSQRREIKAMLRAWEREHPQRIDCIFRSMQKISASHLLDRDAYDFEGLAEKTA